MSSHSLLTDVSASAERRRWIAPMMLVALMGLVAIGVQRFAVVSGGLQLSQGYSGDGDPAIRTGSSNYPREALDRDGFRVVLPHRAHRIVSQYWSIDDYVYAVAPAETVVAVSESAYQPAFSNAYAFAQRFHPAVAGDAERVLRLDPDLVLVGDDSTPEYISQMRSAGLPVYRMQVTFQTLRQVADSIRLTGYLTGYDESAKAAAEHFEQAVGEAKQKAIASQQRGSPAPRVLGLGGMSYCYGKQTLFDDMVKTLGGSNVAADAGLKGFNTLNKEQLIRWNPDWIVIGADKGKIASTLESLESDPSIALTNAARHHHILVLENHVFQPMSPYSALLVSAMADAFYGNGGAL